MTATTAKAARSSASSKPYVCLECGRTMTLRSAERAMEVGCPKCGGSDIDLNVRSSS